MPRRSDPRRTVFAVFDGVQSLDVTGPVEVFAGALQLLRSTGRDDPGYATCLVSADGSPVRTSSGLVIDVEHSLRHAPRQIDTLVVPGGPGWARAVEDPRLMRWLAGAAASARRTVSVCTGAFLLAGAGLLDGRRATTHWAFAEELARRHPRIDVDPEPIFVRDGRVWTSAGATAGMDLALALVEEDLDREAALAIARHLVLFLRRPGNQAQFSATITAQEPAREPLRDAMRFIVENVHADLS